MIQGPPVVPATGATAATPLERAVVAAADAALRVATVLRRGRHRPSPASVRRVLALRLERIGDLVMALPAIETLRAAFPAAEVDLVVGSWSAPLAAMVPGLARVETLDAAWLGRGQGGLGVPGLLRYARQWRSRRYDVAVNLEGDIRSNLLVAATGAWTAGFGHGGGGPLLDYVAPFRADDHVAVNAVRLVHGAAGIPWPADGPAGDSRGRAAALRLPRPRLEVPAGVRAAADARLAWPGGRVAPGGWLGVQVGAGRAVKQWAPEFAAAVVNGLAHEHGLAVVLTGAPEDQEEAAALAHRLAPSVPVLDLVGALTLAELVGVLARLRLFLTPDTGPMHVAAALDTPLVAVFGPSTPERWGPVSHRSRIVRIDLTCSPCNRIRKPPAPCVGVVPACLAGLRPEQALAAARELLCGGPANPVVYNVAAAPVPPDPPATEPRT